jgi:hypothetical protein
LEKRSVTYLAIHDGRAQRLLGSPIRRVECAIQEKAEDGRKFGREMRRGMVAAGTVPGDEVEQPRQQMPGSDVAAVCGDVTGREDRACRVRPAHRLNVAWLRRPRVRVGDVAAAPDRMRQARVMCRPIELAIRAPAVADKDAVESRR